MRWLCSDGIVLGGSWSGRIIGWVTVCHLGGWRVCRLVSGTGVLVTSEGREVIADVMVIVHKLSNLGAALLNQWFCMDKPFFYASGGLVELSLEGLVEVVVGAGVYRKGR